MNIAIIGAGLSGLATAWHLLQKPGVKVDIYDAAGIGGGASGVAAGLLHTYVGAKATLNWRGREGYAAALKLIKASEQAVGKPVSSASGLLRPALTDAQKTDYARSAELHDDIKLLSPADTSTLVPGVPAVPGLLIPSAVTIHGSLYLEGLGLACKKLGAHFREEKIDSLRDLDHYDRIVITTGAGSTTFPELAQLPLTPVKGQLLEFAWPEGMPPLPIPLSSHAYILMAPDGKSCLVGSTYEKTFLTPEPEPEIARELILPKAYLLYPQLREMQEIGCRAGVRVSTPGHKPILKQINAKTYALVGMGSKGLLYHGLYGEELAASIHSSF